MVTEPDTEDQTRHGDGTVFVRDFAGKAFLLFHYHDLGYWLRDAGSKKEVFGGRADEIGRLIAPFVEKNIRSKQYRPLLQVEFFKPLMAGSKKDPEFPHGTFLEAVKSDLNDGESLTKRRKEAKSPSDWIRTLSTDCIIWVSVAHLLDANVRSIEKEEEKKNVGFGELETGYVSIEPGTNRQMLQLFSGARLHGKVGTIGTLERTPASRIGNGYGRDKVIVESLAHCGVDYKPSESFATEVETRILLRLAVGFGFGCNRDDIATIKVWESAMASSGNTSRQNAWKAFAGSPDLLADGSELRGGTLAEFAEAYVALLNDAGSLDGKPIWRSTEAQRRTHESFEHPSSLSDLPRPDIHARIATSIRSQPGCRA